VLEEALAEVAQDPWRFEAPALVLTREGLTMVRFAQSDREWSPPHSGSTTPWSSSG
jgi:hypothetical protein